MVPSANSFEETEWFCSGGKTFFALGAPLFILTVDYNKKTYLARLRDVLLKSMASTKIKNVNCYNKPILYSNYCGGVAKKLMTCLPVGRGS